jgi:hypothetical protein
MASQLFALLPRRLPRARAQACGGNGAYAPAPLPVWRHRFIRETACRAGLKLSKRGGLEMPVWLLVLIIVLAVLFLFGGFGYARR